MLPDNHHQITLRTQTGYDGRIDPVRKIELQVGEVVIECQKRESYDIVSLSSWKTLEKCPFCDTPTGYAIGESPARASKKPEQKQSTSSYVEGHRDFRRVQVLALVTLVLIVCLGIGGLSMYFALNGFDSELFEGSPTPKPVAEVSTVPQPTAEPSSTLQPTITATSTLQTTATSIPRSSPTRTLSPTRILTRNPTPTATRVSPSPTPLPVTCSQSPGPRWGSTLWNQYQSRLGCALNQEIRTGGAYQIFQRGIAVWRQDASRIYILYDNRSFVSFPDNSPSGYYDTDMLKGGFGYLWNNNNSVRDGLGQPVTIEFSATDFAAQDFERGTIFYFLENEAYNYILFSDNSTWTSTQS